MSGLRQQQYVPADPPVLGRYAVWRAGKPLWDWEVAVMTTDGQWRHPDGSGAMHDVHFFMDVGGEEARPESAAE